eukprot:7089918-Pyramimonas_sp.AAC.1
MESPRGVKAAPAEASKTATSSGVNEYTATGARSNQADTLSEGGFVSKAMLCLAEGDDRGSAFEFVGGRCEGREVDGRE